MVACTVTTSQVVFRPGPSARAMTIPLGRLEVRVSLVQSTAASRIWEEAAAAGLDDADLAQLSGCNTRVAEEAIWAQRQHLLVDCLR